jgi:hypothetical protein
LQPHVSGYGILLHVAFKKNDHVPERFLIGQCSAASHPPPFSWWKRALKLGEEKHEIRN